MTSFLDFRRLERSRTPNDYLVAPKGLTPTPPDRAAPVYPCKPTALFDAILGLLKDEKNFHHIEADAAQQAIRAVAITPILRFRDDVDIRVVPADGGASLAIYSRSRIGRGDLGANRKRVEGLLEQLGRL